MPAPVGVKVQGARTLRKGLKQAGIDVQDLKDVHAKVAAQVAERAASRAPRRTGRLAESVRSSGTQTAAIVRAGKKAVPYAGPIHWGWPKHHITAQPFIYNAAGELRDRNELEYLAALEKIIAKIEGAPGP